MGTLSLFLTALMPGGHHAGLDTESFAFFRITLVVQLRG